MLCCRSVACRFRQVPRERQKKNEARKFRRSSRSKIRLLAPVNTNLTRIRRRFPFDEGSKVKVTVLRGRESIRDRASS